MRGLTLLEVLLSLALMTLMATATLPLVRSARSLSHQPPTHAQSRQSFQEQVEAFDAKTFIASDTGHVSTTEFDVVALHGSGVVEPKGEKHLWLRFQSEDWVALRCVVLPSGDLEATESDPQR